MSPHLEDDVDDDGTTTREAKEEIGLVPSLVNVVAILEPFFSKDLGYYQIPNF
ncbi:putative NUDIX hydrolase-like domain superfamily [Helianthus debilis subsp. tardiflorus]